MRAQVPIDERRNLTLYAIGQKRGPTVHTFISTFGMFTPEVPARFPNIKEVSAAPFTTPSILNVVTKAQPMIDKFNRTCFDQLGMHDTFVVHCFETRFVQHFLMPITYVNAVYAAKYFLPHLYPKDETCKTVLLKLARSMVANKDWKDEKLIVSSSGSPSASRFNQVRINGGPPSRESPHKHVLVPLKEIKGYKGAKQQRCFVCNKLCSWACARCSSASSMVPLHPTICQGSKRQFNCLKAHRDNPTGSEYRQMHETISGTSRVCKRRRRLDIEVVA